MNKEIYNDFGLFVKRIEKTDRQIMNRVIQQIRLSIPRGLDITQCEVSYDNKYELTFSIEGNNWCNEKRIIMVTKWKKTNLQRTHYTFWVIGFEKIKHLPKYNKHFIF